MRQAAEDGLRVKAVGTGHSFTAIAATDGVLIRPDLLTGHPAASTVTAMTVTVEAGTPLKRLNAALAREGLSLTNMGDIMEQTVSGRDQHRHARHGPRLGLDRRPDQGPGAGHGRRLGAAPAPRRRTRRSSRRPGSASARSASSPRSPSPWSRSSC